MFLINQPEKLIVLGALFIILVFLIIGGYAILKAQACWDIASYGYNYNNGSPYSDSIYTGTYWSGYAMNPGENSQGTTGTVLGALGIGGSASGGDLGAMGGAPGTGII